MFSIVFFDLFSKRLFAKLQTLAKPYVFFFWCVLVSNVSHF